ncbi:carboxymuconolactone decarboxylase family protein [Dietzia maris]|uniref:Carboxymuconolactone decarboxylase family protein n=1 Tax=Dietzia maris TaxID=37915 RepID=A0ABT8H062_9ACTN|nr:carboxymuconolactone decarboxylase family protein [Dietzia maris]MDN4505854.1 carboxymuconolactone decarboxylase family protein [Dietzia maris]
MSTSRSGSTQRKQVSAGAMAPMLALEAYSRARVSREDSHLVRLRVSAVNGCRYCLAMHRRDARKDGWSETRIAVAETWPAHAEELSPAERAVLAFADAVTHIDGEDSVPDEVWDEVARHRGESGAGQLVMEIVTINAWNRIAIATRKDPATLRGLVPSDMEPTTRP